MLEQAGKFGLKKIARGESYQILKHKASKLKKPMRHSHMSNQKDHWDKIA